MDYTGTFILGWFFLNDSLRSERVNRYLEVLPLLEKLFMLHMHRSRVCPGLLPFSPQSQVSAIQGPHLLCMCPDSTASPHHMHIPTKGPGSVFQGTGTKMQVASGSSPHHRSAVLSSPLHHGFCFQSEFFHSSNTNIWGLMFPVVG